ncbi:blast:Tissue factor pathway inhibitor [Drosophila guanche]|uniref:Blast:Tissue factor pathway inhibitor n=1 Tax=Drosophila guanche TaxID=7266 RepID=A0A3B0K0D8_DROGU|nr:blast:Tissue factor pathway inhibitor [Drosophila guanche]
MFWLRLALVSLFVWLASAKLKGRKEDLYSNAQDESETMLYIKRRVFCSQDPSYGACKGNRSLWYYNNIGHQCERFIYSNCGGNQNRFYSYEECANQCFAAPAKLRNHFP